MGDIEVEKLFYELASGSRLGILLELKQKDWKMNDLARKLDLTTTETFRQLQRLTEASLAKKQPEGTYAITEYGQLILEFTVPLGFMLKNKEYFLTHDVRCLPHHLLMRLDALSNATLIEGMVQSTTKISTMIGEAKQFMWGISPEPLAQTIEAINKAVPQKAEYHILSPQPYSKLSNIENRTLMKPPLIMALNETHAAVCFRLVGGKVDYASFFGDDPSFHEWAKEVFLYFWNKTNRA